MKTDWSHLESARITSGDYGSNRGDHFGAFRFWKGKTSFLLISTDGLGRDEGEEGIGWEHVSLSMAYQVGRKMQTKMPGWEDMCWVKDLFWEAEEAVMQLHPPQSDWVNNHAGCLHLWRPINQPIPLPPSICVGDANLGILVK